MVDDKIEKTMLRVREALDRAQAGLSDAAAAFLDSAEWTSDPVTNDHTRHCAQMLQSTAKMLSDLTRSTTKKLQVLAELRRKYDIPDRLES